MFVFQKYNFNFLSGETPDGIIIAGRGGDKRYRYLSNGNPLFTAFLCAYSFCYLRSIANGSAAVFSVPRWLCAAKTQPFLNLLSMLFYLYYFFNFLFSVCQKTLKSSIFKECSDLLCSNLFRIADLFGMMVCWEAQNLLLYNKIAKM